MTGSNCEPAARKQNSRGSQRTPCFTRSYASLFDMLTSSAPELTSVVGSYVSGEVSATVDFNARPKRRNSPCGSDHGNAQRRLMVKH